MPIYITVKALCAFPYKHTGLKYAITHTFVHAHENYQCQAVTSLSLELF